MGQEIFKDLKLSSTERAPSVQQISRILSRNFEEVSNVGSDFSSLILAGGAGFGDFNYQSSDVDVWLVMHDLTPEERLLKAKELNVRFEIARNKTIEAGVLGTHNFRHPPTFLTEPESIGYRKAFAAKVGLPISLGVFPTISGSERKGEVCFTEDQLIQDLAYSCNVFRNNLLNPPNNGTEDPLRYCYKRATYFLRFALLYEKGLYVPRQELLLSEGEKNLPEWNSVMPMMWQIHDPFSQVRPDIEHFQNSIDRAMQKEMNIYREDGIIDEVKIAKGDVRTKIFWTLEKLRWDYLLLPREDEVLTNVMTNQGQKLWGFSFSQVDNLFGKYFQIVEDKETETDWINFRRQHEQVVGGMTGINFKNYYDLTYHPTLTTFFDRIIRQTDCLY